MMLALLIVTLFAAVACLWNRGLWTAALTFINTVFAALLAMNFFEPLAGAFDSAGRSNTWTFLCLWLLFAVFSTVFRVVTDLVSRLRVRFPYGLDVGGAVVFALLTGWVMVCFTITSLHVSPLPRTALAGSFMAQPDERILGGLAPDRRWLAFVRHVSLGSLSNSQEGFDPQGEFVFKYAARRAAGKRPG